MDRRDGEVRHGREGSRANGEVSFQFIVVSIIIGSVA
jgi:hypothetical protein